MSFIGHIVFNTEGTSTNDQQVTAVVRHKSTSRIWQDTLHGFVQNSFVVPTTSRADRSHNFGAMHVKLIPNKYSVPIALPSQKSLVVVHRSQPESRLEQAGQVILVDAQILRLIVAVAVLH